MAENNDDFIFGRLENEMKQIEEQKRKNAQRVKESERHWFAQMLLDIGRILGKIITAPFEILSDFIQKILSDNK